MDPCEALETSRQQHTCGNQIKHNTCTFVLLDLLEDSLENMQTFFFGFILLVVLLLITIIGSLSQLMMNCCSSKTLDRERQLGIFYRIANKQLGRRAHTHTC